MDLQRVRRDAESKYGRADIVRRYLAAAHLVVPEGRERLAASPHRLAAPAQAAAGEPVRDFPRDEVRRLRAVDVLRLDAPIIVFDPIDVAEPQGAQAIEGD